MQTIAIILMVAIVLEALIEYVKTIIKMIENGDIKTAVTQAITIVLGIALAFAFNLRLFNDALSEVYQGLSVNPTLDMILTGILFSRGSNYFSDLVRKLSGKDDIDFINPDDLIYNPLMPTDALSSEDGSVAQVEDEEADETPISKEGD